MSDTLDPQALEAIRAICEKQNASTGNVCIETDPDAPDNWCWPCRATYLLRHIAAVEQERDNYLHLANTYSDRGIRLTNERDALAAEVSKMRAKNIEQAMLAGQLLGKESDGMPLVEVATECVRLRAEVQTLTKNLEDAQSDNAANTDEVQRLRAAQAWQPIETAPKDGGFFVLHNFNGVIAVGYWLTKTAGSPCWWATGYGAFQPTHWQPLPAPPLPRARDSRRCS